MPRIQITVQNTTPLLIYGADNKDDRVNRNIRAEPELRATSIRGILRYWLRAVLGSSINSVERIYEAESSILGSTDKGSRIQVRVARSRSLEVERGLTVLPAQTRGFNLTHTGFAPDGEFRITLSTHPLDSNILFVANSNLVKALFLMLHFGGLGRRARRGGGNLRVVAVKGYQGDHKLDYLPENRDDAAAYLREIAQFISPNNLGRRPNFPVFSGDTAVVLLGKETHADYEDAFKELWRVSGPYHSSGGIFGDVRPRRASAIHMRVMATQAGYVSQQTILYSGTGQWGTMREYIESCLYQDFEPIYGTWESWQ